MIRPARTTLAVSLVAVLAWPAGIAYSTGTMTPKQATLQGMVATAKLREQKVSRLIVKLKTPKSQALAAQATGMSEARAQSLAVTAGRGMKALRTTAGGAQLMQLDEAVPLSQARAMAARLSQDADVEYAEPDVQFRRLAVPNEPRFTQWQWNLFAPTSTFTANSVTTPATGGANLPPAWDYTTGSDAVVVAVIDSGIVNHPDLNGLANADVYSPAGRFLPGYDFVSADALGIAGSFVANDGNGRDADPSDPGDWISVQDKTGHPDECTVEGEDTSKASDSSWHGSHVAGVIAATANNNVGIAGIGWGVRILPVRALGKCGGNLSDIADAIRWAAGAQPENGMTWQQNGVTVGANTANPAKVINLSLGGGDTCGPSMQSAVDAAIAAGAVVIAATGNGSDVNLVAPANCNGVIAVTAHTINGENADYANIGTGTTLSAPGGGSPILLGRNGTTDNENFDGYYVFSSVLFGATTPTSLSSSGGNVGPAYAGFVGTSVAAPHVAGVAALLKSSVPSATPGQIRSYLVSSSGVRAYPAGSACASGGAFVGRCGAGLLDAGLALALTGNDASPAAAAGSDQIVAPGAAVTLTGSGSKAFNGKTISSYEWIQTAGTMVVLSNAATASTNFTAPSTGALSFRLRVTDSMGKTGDDLVSVRVNSAPVLAEAPADRTATVGETVAFSVAASDADGDAITYVAGASSTAPVSALLPSGAFSWNTTGYGAGTYTLAYFATDGLAQSPTQTVTITLSGGNSAVPPSGGGGGGGSWNWAGVALLLSLLLLRSAATRQRKGQSQ